MQLSQLPTLLKLAFAALGGKNTIPVASQLPGVINGASYTDGFPPATRTAIAAGGKPPAGLDMNGVLFDLSSHVRWLNAGGPYAFSSGFASDANVGGYPQGACIASADLLGAWISLNDNNTDDPDGGAGTKWVPGRAYGITAITGLTNANVTLTPAQAAKNKITFAGTLTGNVQANFPTWLRDWTVVNNTTGAFTLTCKTASGTGIVIPQDGSPTKIVGDGTNITQPAENVAAATQSTHPVQFGQVSGVVGSSRNLKCNNAAAGTSLTFTADEIVAESALGSLRYCLANFNATVASGTTGLGGLDTGTTLAANSFYAVYAAIKSDGTKGAFAQLEPAGGATSVYSGANLPANVVATALISAWPTNASGQFIPGLQTDRTLSCYNASQGQALNSSVTQSTPIALSISSLVPKCAKYVSGNLQMQSTAASTENLGVYPTSATFGTQGNLFAAAGSSATISQPYARLQLGTPQTIYYTATNTAGTPTFQIFVTSYEI